MDIAQVIKGNLAFAITKILQKKVDAKEVGKELDRKLDQSLGRAGSEKIQRGPLTDILLDLIEGLWSENLNSFKYHLTSRVKELDSVTETVTFGKKGRK